MAGILSGLATYGRHVGVGSSYGAFLAPLGHIAARLHAIGAQAKAPHGPWSPVPPRLRPRGPQDRRGRAHPRRPAAAAAPAGELPARDDDHAHPVGPRGDLDAAGGGLPAPAGGHRAVRHAAERDGPRPRRPRPRPGRGGGDRRLPPPQAAGEGRRGHDRAAGERRGLRLRRAGAAAPREGRHRPARLLRGERGALRPAAGRGAGAHLPGGARARGDGDHGLHPADALPLGRLRPRPRAHAPPVHARATSSAAARGRWSWPRPGSTARARRRRSGPTWRRGSRPRSPVDRRRPADPRPRARGLRPRGRALPRRRHPVEDGPGDHELRRQPRAPRLRQPEALRRGRPRRHRLRPRAPRGVRHARGAARGRRAGSSARRPRSSRRPSPASPRAPSTRPTPSPTTASSCRAAASCCTSACTWPSTSARPAT